MLKLYHGGLSDARRRTRRLAETDFEYAACYAEMCEVDHVLEMTPDLAPSEILDLRAHGFDAKAVAAALINAAIPGSRSRRRASCSSAHCNVF